MVVQGKGSTGKRKSRCSSRKKKPKWRQDPGQQGSVRWGQGDIYNGKKTCGETRVAWVFEKGLDIESR